MAETITNQTRFTMQSGTAACRIEGSILYLSGELMINDAGSIVRDLIRRAGKLKHNDLSIDLEELTDIDSAGVMAVTYLQQKLSAGSGLVTIRGGNASIKRKMKLFGPESAVNREAAVIPGIAEQTGQGTWEFFRVYIYGFILLAADVFYWSVTDIFRKKTRREGELVNQAVRIGVNAALIIIFMSFAIGLVLAVHSGNQLRNFGANIYIVDLTVIAIMSQMGPLITAILVAGRSGSSIAAEIATMKVTSELDALKTMGLDPIRFVVIPKLHASLLTMPFLIILANVSGIAGGATAAYYNLDITPEVFISRMEAVMQNKDLLTGFIKSQVYASLIVLTGSFYGFRVDRGAEGVGRVTTTAVVVAISLVILADSVMGLLFY